MIRNKIGLAWAAFLLALPLAAQIEVTSTGVGIGTSTPNLYGAGNGTFLTLAGTGANGGADGRLELANPKSGITAGDGVGELYFTAPGITGVEKRAAGLFTLVEGSGGTNGYGGVLEFFSKADNSATWNRMVLNSAGNVGIGTISPSRKLDVNGDANIGTNLVVQTAIYAGALYSLGSGINLRNASSGNILLLAEGGNVGIGTMTPGYKLEVAGPVRATSFISNSTTYADFVFKPDYKLRPLADVEAAIRRDGHLPDIPSEAEVKARGVDLASQQAKLLQKVEELTLYVIDLKKENAALREDLAHLASQRREDR